ncbi:hypothetical protein IGI37_001692 [Enterococcus sp. AZ194]|uniref:GFA family protein n=1 Tax=Enterococcus sp. AZ194 TaxID=2774629 RepID=UPI003F27370B
MHPVTCSCLCKKVSFTAVLKDWSIEVCHCAMCRKMMGSSGFLGMKCVGELTMSSKEALGSYSSSEKGQRGFCKHCGTSLYYYFLSEKTYFVPAGVVDNLPENKVTITTEIYYDNKPCYYDYVGQTKKYLETDFA